MTIELSLLLSGISVAFATFFGISNKKRNDKKDAEQETEERATANTLMMTKLENIADDVKDIKRDYKETRAEVQDLHDRVLIVEQSLKSYHNVFRFLSVEGGAMALIKSVKTVTKKDTGKQHENEPDDINADNNEEVQG